MTIPVNNITNTSMLRKHRNTTELANGTQYNLNSEIQALTGAYDLTACRGNAVKYFGIFKFIPEWVSLGKDYTGTYSDLTFGGTTSQTSNAGSHTGRYTTIASPNTFTANMATRPGDVPIGYTGDFTLEFYYWGAWAYSTSTALQRFLTGFGAVGYDSFIRIQGSNPGASNNMGTIVVYNAGATVMTYNIGNLYYAAPMPGSQNNFGENSLILVKRSNVLALYINSTRLAVVSNTQAWDFQSIMYNHTTEFSVSVSPIELRVAKQSLYDPNSATITPQKTMWTS